MSSSRSCAIACAEDSFLKYPLFYLAQAALIHLGRMNDNRWRYAKKAFVQDLRKTMFHACRKRSEFTNEHSGRRKWRFRSDRYFLLVGDIAQMDSVFGYPCVNDWPHVFL